MAWSRARTCTSIRSRFCARSACRSRSKPSLWQVALADHEEELPALPRDHAIGVVDGAEGLARQRDVRHAANVVAVEVARRQHRPGIWDGRAHRHAVAPHLEEVAEALVVDPGVAVPRPRRWRPEAEAL